MNLHKNIFLFATIVGIVSFTLFYDISMSTIGDLEILSVFLFPGIFFYISGIVPDSTSVTFSMLLNIIAVNIIVYTVYYSYKYATLLLTALQRKISHK